jgi:ribosomal protein S27AE
MGFGVCYYCQIPLIEKSKDKIQSQEKTTKDELIDSTEEIKFCPNCGFKNPEDSSFCGMCGFTLNQTETTNQTAIDAQETLEKFADGPPTSGLAVTSLFTGILGIIMATTAFFAVHVADNIWPTWGIFVALGFIIAVLAVIFGVIACNQKGYSKELATLGLILGIIEVVVVFIIWAVASFEMAL